MTLMNVVGFVTEAHGFRALVKILFPLSERGKQVWIEDLRIDGCYLQQVSGRDIVPFDVEF